MPTLDNTKNCQYVAKSRAKKRAELGDEEYRRIESMEQALQSPSSGST